MGPRDAGVAGCPSRGRPDGGTLASFGQKAARAPQDEDGRARAEVRLIAEPFVGVPAHDVKQPISFPRRISAPGVCNFASPTPNEGWAERRETFGCVRGTRGACHSASKTRVNALMTRHARRLARRLASHNAGRSPLGAPPWRFFTRGRASVSFGARRHATAGICLADPCSELLAARS